jgi:calcineurin-like phosphoesterase family protein
VSEIFFTADTHLGHANILSYDKTRGKFKSLEEHDETIIANWNKTVGPRDIVYHLGDFALVSDSNIYHRRLNGKKIILIWGNHDWRNKAKLKSWAVEQDVMYLKEHNLFLSHYPHYSWPKSHRGCIHLFGHVHEEFKHVPGLDRKVTKNMNVGVTWHNFTPVHLDRVLAL